MKRLIAILTATAILGGPFAMGGAAMARDHRGDGRGEARREQAQPQPQQPPQRGREEYRGGGDPRGYGGPPRETYAPRESPYRADPRAYAPPPQAYSSPSPRRGGYLSPQAAPAMPDYGRYRLREPPRGYAWVRTSNGYAMVRTDTGQVFDVIPY